MILVTPSDALIPHFYIKIYLYFDMFIFLYKFAFKYDNYGTDNMFCK